MAAYWLAPAAKPPQTLTQPPLPQKWRPMVYETQTQHAIPLACTIWNYNGTLWSDPGNFLESYTGHDTVFYTKIHQSPERPLPPASGYMWELAFHEETRDTGGVRGSGGVAVLFKSMLISLISMVKRDTHA